MSKQNYRNRGKEGLGVNRHGGKRAFRYQLPPEVAGQLPPGTTVTLVSLTHAEIYDLARRVEPAVTGWFDERPAKNALEALLLMVQAIYALLQPPELPIPHKEMVEIAQTLANGYDFAPTWPYTRAQLQAAFIHGHPENQPATTVPQEHILYVAGEVEKRLLLQMAEEGVTLRDATQAGMLVVAMTHKVLFEESPVFGADEHEMYYVAQTLVAAHIFHPAWPFRDQVKTALVSLYHLPQE